MLEREAKEYRQRRGIVVEDTLPLRFPNPITSFDNSGFPQSIIQQLSNAGFVRPTPLQSQVWPMALNGHDLIAVADTGSGKTLTYLLPAIVHAKNSTSPSSPQDGPIVLILAPTMKIVEQIKKECDRFGSALGIKSVHEHRDWDYKEYKESRGGFEILIATPNGLEIALEYGRISLQRVTYLVVDDADRMDENKYTIGRIPDVVSRISPDCQRLFFSANYNPEKVHDLVTRFGVSNAYKVAIGSPTIVHCSTMSQDVRVVKEGEKYEELVKLLRSGIVEDGSRMLIFLGSKEGCDEISARLRDDGWPAISIHSEDFYQADEGRHVIMTATDVTANDHLEYFKDYYRNVKYVVNYEFPASLDDYIHRITDPSGEDRRAGTSFTFFTAGNASFAKGLISLLEKCGQTISPELAALGLDAPHVERTFTIIYKSDTEEEEDELVVGKSPYCLTSSLEPVVGDHDGSINNIRDDNVEPDGSVAASRVESLVVSSTSDDDEEEEEKEEEGLVASSTSTSVSVSDDDEETHSLVASSTSTTSDDEWVENSTKDDDDERARFCGYSSDEDEMKNIIIGGQQPIEPTYANYREIRNNARFAVEQVNKKKNRHLHFVRVLEAHKRDCIGPYEVYYLTFEVVDEDGVVKACEAEVGEELIAACRLKLDWFGLA